MRIIFIICILFLFYVRQGLSNDQETNEISDGEISKMKIKDLRLFLADRGLECFGCAEKSDFVEMAKKNKHIPLIKQKQNDQDDSQNNNNNNNDNNNNNNNNNNDNDNMPFDNDDNLNDILNEVKADKEESKETIGKYWEKRAISQCQKAKNKDKNGSWLPCKEYGTIINGILRDMVKNMGSVLGKTEHQIVKISQKQPYLSAGDRALYKGYQSAMSTKKNSEEMRQAISKEISSWFLHTVMENPQSLYQGMDLDELLRTMKNQDAPPSPPPPPRQSPRTKGRREEEATQETDEEIEEL